MMMLRAERLHLVAHSLGGIVLHHLFRQFPDLPPGRVVLLGSPVRGSGVARRMAVSPFLRPLLGSNREEGLLGDVPPWPPNRELGVIAGNRGLGVGRLIGGLEHKISKVNLGRKGTYYRLKVGPFDSAAGAKAMCAKLKRRRQYCEATVME